MRKRNPELRNWWEYFYIYTTLDKFLANVQNTLGDRLQYLARYICLGKLTLVAQRRIGVQYQQGSRRYQVGGRVGPRPTPQPIAHRTRSRRARSGRGMYIEDE